MRGNETEYCIVNTDMSIAMNMVMHSERWGLADLLPCNRLPESLFQANHRLNRPERSHINSSESFSDSARPLRH